MGRLEKRGLSPAASVLLSFCCSFLLILAQDFVLALSRRLHDEIGPDLAVLQNTALADDGVSADDAVRQRATDTHKSRDKQRRTE